MKTQALIAAIALCACAPATETASAPAKPAAPVQPIDLKSIQSARDWQYATGDKLNAGFNTDAAAMLGKLSRPDAIQAITDAGFECIYGEAHQDYPDPMAVCTKSFATRACQFTWEIASTADKGMVDDVDASFRRDCVGTDQDWPDKVESAIDNQLAPAAPAPN
jgi:hypothetical protein